MSETMIIAIFVSSILFLLMGSVLRVRWLEKFSKELLSDLKKEYDSHGEARHKLWRLRNFGNVEEKN